MMLFFIHQFSCKIQVISYGSFISKTTPQIERDVRWLTIVHPEMALFVLIGVLLGFPAAAYRRTPRRKPLCGLDQNKNCSFLNWTPIMFTLNSWMDTN
jgi:hypothetical protein